MDNQLMTTPVWLVRAGGHGEDEATALDQGLVIIGYRDVPDLEQANSLDRMLSLVQSARPQDSINRARTLASQVFAFAHRISVGDTVVLPLKTHRGSVAIGRIAGPYVLREVAGERRHTRKVEWIRPEVSRDDFEQDLLYSFGAFMTVCRIQRHDAERRVAIVLVGKTDPGPETAVQTPNTTNEQIVGPDPSPGVTDIAELATDQVRNFVKSRFAGHGLSRLVAALLEAEGYRTDESPPGPDGGIDILAGRGILGLDPPRICVQVKSSPSPSDVNVFRALQGTMQQFKADQGLLVSWGGFTKALRQEARQSSFTVRLWNASDFLEALYEAYDHLSEEVRTELPLKRVWALVVEEESE